MEYLNILLEKYYGSTNDAEVGYFGVLLFEAKTPANFGTHTNAVRGPKERRPDPEKCRLTQKGKDLAVPLPQLH